MQSAPPLAPTSDLATPAEVAEYRRVTVAALAQERYLGRGPAYVKTGRTIRYQWADVLDYLDGARVTPGK